MLTFAPKLYDYADKCALDEVSFEPKKPKRRAEFEG